LRRVPNKSRHDVKVVKNPLAGSHDKFTRRVTGQKESPVVHKNPLLGNPHLTRPPSATPITSHTRDAIVVENPLHNAVLPSPKTAKPRVSERNRSSSYNRLLGYQTISHNTGKKATKKEVREMKVVINPLHNIPSPNLSPSTGVAPSPVRSPSPGFALQPQGKKTKAHAFSNKHNEKEDEVVIGGNCISPTPLSPHVKKEEEGASRRIGRLVASLSRMHLGELTKEDDDSPEKAEREIVHTNPLLGMTEVNIGMGVDRVMGPASNRSHRTTSAVVEEASVPQQRIRLPFGRK
jgi:hypothetical protein